MCLVLYYITYVMWDFSEITIIARNSDVKGISAVLETLQGTIGEGGGVKFAVCEVGDGEDAGSADALLTLKGRVKVCELGLLDMYYHDLT